MRRNRRRSPAIIVSTGNRPGNICFGEPCQFTAGSIGTIANEFGFYSITLPEGEYELTASFIGYERVTKKVVVDRDKTVNFDLSINSELVSAKIRGKVEAGVHATRPGSLEIPQNMIGPIQKTKVNYLHGHNPRLHTDEVLVAISMMSLLDENCQQALAQLPNLAGAQVHSAVMLSEVDRKTFQKLGVGLTCDPIRKVKPLKAI